MTDRTHSMLLTDLYELTMAAAFFENKFNPTATFELFVRRLPKNRGYLVAAGLEQALEWLQTHCCAVGDVDFLRNHPAFRHVSGEFFEYLRELKFSGDIWAVPEGTVVFGEEPIVRVTAPLIEAQVLETYFLSAVTFQTMVASKAARVVQAAQGRDVIEFGTRRAHGPDAGVFAARASYIAGCAGTSNVEAGYRFGIPTSGTIAHSFIMAMEDETEAFKRYSKIFPESSVLLIDTYDTLRAVDSIIAAGLKPTGVRIDSGDLAELAKEVRRRLDAGGLSSTKILVSGDLDEYKITDLLAQGAPIDGFGVGTSLVTSSDAPSLGGVYKLVEVEHNGRMNSRAKFSKEKMTRPGAKQIYRFRDERGQFSHDLVACAGEAVSEGEPLLREITRGGRRLVKPETLDEIRRRAEGQIESLPESVRRLETAAEYPVKFSRKLLDLLAALKTEHVGK